MDPLEQRWLRSDILPPVPVGKRRVFRIGRAQGCDLVLPHAEVSRIHARVEVLGRDTCLLRDSSRNGTYINGRRLTTPHLLREGDRIALGPYTFEFALTPCDSDSASTGDATITSITIEREAAMAGSLSSISLVDILPLVEATERSGTLTVRGRGGRQGTMVFVGGFLVQCKLKHDRGLEAALELLGVTEGTFVYTSGVKELEPEMRQSVTGLLLELARRQDQRARERREQIRILKAS